LKMSSEAKNANAKQQQQASLIDILSAVNKQQYLQQCKEAGLEEILEQIHELTNEQIYKVLINKNIPGFSARVIANKLRPQQEGLYLLFW